MKHVQESLSQYYDYKFFKVLEDKEETKEKTEIKDKEGDGLKIIDKIIKNFEDFKADAGDEIIKYKEFWEENKTTKEGFVEGGSGAIYKMYDSNYVAGVLELPVQTLSDGSIDGGMGATDEPEEEIIEGKEIGADQSQDMSEGDEPPVNEAEDASADSEDDLNLDEPTDEPTDDVAMDDQPTDAAPEEDLSLGDETGGDTSMEEPTEEQPMDDANMSAPQTYFVVYDISGDEREEIFRCGSNNVVNAFNAFYNDTFKGAMKNIILKYKEQKEALKKEAEAKEKQKAETTKQSKVDKFLSESKIAYIKNAHVLNEKLTPGTFRAIEGAIEDRFCNDEGDIDQDADYQEQFEFLIDQGFDEADIREYLGEYFE